MSAPEARQNGRREGEARKRTAHSNLEAHRDAAIRRARRALLTRLLDRGIATADDVAEGIEPPEGVDPRYLGTVPGPLARARIIHHVGYVKSDRPSRHASVLTLWGLTDRAAALAWLAHNPDIPDPPLEDEDGDADMPCQAPPTPPPSRLTSQSLLF